MSKSVRDRLLNHPYTQKAAGRVSRHRRWLYGLGIVFILFGLLGYFWLPGFAKNKAEALLSEQLHRPVTIERIEIHPYTLEATIHGFRVGEREGEGSLLKFESLYVNLSITSIARAAPVISAVTLKSPELHVSRTADGRFSFADLIEDFMKQPKSEESARFSVSNIQVVGGSVVFDDKFKHGTQRVSDINLGIPFVASFASAEDVWVQPHFSARINDGSRVEVTGKALPFADKREASLDIKLSGLDLTGVDEYAPQVSGIKLGSALLDTDLAVTFGQLDNKPAELTVKGDITLRQFALDNKGSLPWKVHGERATLHLAKMDLMLRAPIEASVDANDIYFQQSDKPQMHINTLSMADINADVAGHKASFSLAATLNDKGTLKTSGKVGWAPVTAELDIDANNVDIVPTQNMLFERPGILTTRGAASFKGTVVAGGNPLNAHIKGDASISDFNMLDKVTQEDLLRWRSLEVVGLDANTFPLDVAIKSVIHSNFYARIIVMPDGTLRLRDVMAQTGGTLPVVDATQKLVAKQAEAQAETQAKVQVDKKVEKTPSGTVTTATVTEEKPALPIRIDEYVIKNGNVNFNDRFIKPNYRAHLTQLVGRVGPLYPGRPGEVALKGAVNRAAPLEIKGKVDPFGKDLFLDLNAKVKGIDMPSFSPYSSRYIGYEIAKGKLSVDLHYYIEKSQLRAENNIFLDQFTLGEKVESPDAVSLPVGLAVSLLKNSRGEIDIDLPISGSLDDPEFSIGGLIVKVFFNLLAKAVTAPFALLGNMFGGGADLSYIEFAPGRARLTAEAEKSLEAIGKAMADRPALKMEITGVATTATDRDGLKQATLDRRVKTQKLAELARQGKSGGSINDVEVSTAEYPKYLEMAYKAEKFDKPRNLIGMTKSLPVAEMEALMLTNMPAGDDDLRGLAERRARTAYDALIAKGVPGERAFVVQPRIDATAEDKKPGGRADFSLR